GWADVGFHGSRQIPVPNIDALAADGVILNKYYAQPWPLSSRIGLLTGIYPYRTGVTKVMLPCQPVALPRVFRILPTFFKSLGYRTHFVGVWNLGFYKKRFTPVNRGFDTAYAKWTGPGDYWTHVATDDMETKMQGFDLRLNDDLMWNQTGVYSTRLFTERADPTREQCFFVFHQPLLLILSHQALHTANYHGSLQCPLEHLDSFGFIRDRKRRVFAGALTEVDQSLGQIFEALHNRRLLNNTILVFASASGGMPVGDFTNNLSFNFPLRGMKGTYFEGGVRVPAFVWSPLLNKTRRTSTQLMHVTDWLPTLFSAAVPGVDAAGEMAALRSRLVLFLEYGSEVFQKLYGDNWEPADLEKRGSVITCPVMENATKCLLSEGPCLFDLDKDPCEQNNIAASHPEVQEGYTYVPWEKDWMADEDCDPGTFNGAWVSWRDSFFDHYAVKKLKKKKHFG
ncbi:hypothetical protein HPB47_012042, partial [Ixodes persulcatus]